VKGGSGMYRITEGLRIFEIISELTVETAVPKNAIVKALVFMQN